MTKRGALRPNTFIHMKFHSVLLVIAFSVNTVEAAAPAAPLDLRIQYYSRLLTAEGVTREVRYEEVMLRRPGIVWVARALPRARQRDGHSGDAVKTANIAHKHFNPVMLPRLIRLSNSKPQLEYVDVHNKEIISVPQGEFGNVAFDGSWSNTYHLIDPQLVRAMPVSSRASSVPGARWRETARGNIIHRVLWDQDREIALVIESEDKAASSFHRVEVHVDAGATSALPWRDLKGYSRREYGDFLD